MLQFVEHTQALRHFANRSHFLNLFYETPLLTTQYITQVQTCCPHTKLCWPFVSVNTFSVMQFCLNMSACACPFRALHQVACVGKRALGYCIAKRMAALNSLDLKDSAGMVQFKDIQELLF